MKIFCSFLIVSSSLFSGTDLQIGQAQAFQREFDEQYFEINTGFEKLRHILLHLVDTTGKMAAYCEAKEHRNREASDMPMIDEVLPDLLIHALQIANHFQVDLGDKFDERIAWIVKKRHELKQ